MITQQVLLHLCVPRNTSGGFLSLDPTTAAWETAFTSTNHTGQAHPQTFNAVTVTLYLLTAVIALGGLAGNAVVLWLLGFHSRRNAFTVYILNLAAADFLCLCCQVIDSVEALITCCSPSSSPAFLATVMTFAYLAGLSLLSAISTERCMSVRCPVWYRCRRPTHLSAIVCAVLWALALLLSTLEGKYCGLLLTSFSQLWCRVFDFIAAGWLMFLFGLLAGSSLALLLRILRKSQRMQLTRLYVTVVLTVAAFLLCGLPYGILWFLLIWIQDDLFAIPCHHCLVVFGLSCVNSSVNPIIYFFVGSFRQRQAKKRGRGRRTLKAVLQQALEDISELGESESSFPRATLGSGSSLVSGSGLVS
ncbi:mas-related G-protein coupled receptor member X2 [Muntiacus reevesi]|uniref:mas-related G-protein coupled receptor member X2 n=1 Tax=Muntiacus reevesi TaxID=9886 RepID=UPI0033074861